MNKATLLIVDDEPTNLAVLSELLRAEYRIRAARSGEAALDAIRRAPVPDLVLLDVMMPGMDGYAVLARLRADPELARIPVIFLTALGAAEDEERGLLAGAVDYITKPIKPAVVRARVKSQLEVFQARQFLEDQNAYLEAEVERRMAENEAVQQVGIRALAHLAETRDSETGNHILRTQYYVEALAETLAGEPAFCDFLTPGNVRLLTKSAPLHDIGKVGIPDQVLHKPGPLDPEEWVVMKTHARMGYDAIERAESDIGQTLPFLQLAKEIARWHHEHWDGSGYPDGLAGEDIPVAARIMAVADVFDALTSRRVYKEAMPCEAARDLILRDAGKHFDPRIVAAFDAIFDRFVQIARTYADPPAGPG
ncbi:MAG: response regulator [Halothiobacillaceae bacterium]